MKRRIAYYLAAVAVALGVTALTTVAPQIAGVNVPTQGAVASGLEIISGNDRVVVS